MASEYTWRRVLGFIKCSCKCSAGAGEGAGAGAGQPHGAWAFDKLKEYHPRARRFRGPKMYILGQLILGTQIEMFQFCLSNYINIDVYQAQFFYVLRFHYVTSKWPKNGPKSKKNEKIPKCNIYFFDISQRDLCSGYF